MAQLTTDRHYGLAVGKTTKNQLLLTALKGGTTWWTQAFLIQNNQVPP
jgi:hypothetical protein